MEFAGFGGPVGFHFGFEKVEDLVAGGDLALLAGGVEVVHDFGGGFDAQVGRDEALFEFVEEGLVEFAAAEERAEAADEDVAGFGEAGFEFVDGGFGGVGGFGEGFFEEFEGHEAPVGLFKLHAKCSIRRKVGRSWFEAVG